MAPLEKKHPRRIVVVNIRTTTALFLGIAGLVLATIAFSPARAANAGRHQPVARIASNGSIRGSAINNSPDTSATPSPRTLSDVACTSASDCWAVGSDGDISTRTLIQHWDGTSWTIIQSANPNEYNELFGIACVTSSDCWTVGRGFFQNPERTMIQHWDGTSWAIIPSPNYDTANSLSSVACSSATQCWAVGWYDTATYTKTLIQRWDGSSWTVVASPNVANSHDNLLGSVTCPTANSCWAVGDYNSGGASKTLILHWNGGTWVLVSSPNATTTDSNVLGSVTCAAPQDCYAAGYYLKDLPDGDGPYQTLIEHFNGAVWSIVTSANSGPTLDNSLSAVSCASSTDCSAVGLAAGMGSDGMLFEHWNGSAWAIVAKPPPNVPNDFHQFGSMSCTSATNCWVVGVDGSYQPATAHWDGAAWSLCPSLQITGMTEVIDDASATFSIDGQGLGAAQFDVQVTSDLKQPFTTVGSVTLDASRRFHYEDSGPVGAPSRFYRLSIP